MRSLIAIFALLALSVVAAHYGQEEQQTCSREAPCIADMPNAPGRCIAIAHSLVLAGRCQ